MEKYASAPLIVGPGRIFSGPVCIIALFRATVDITLH